MEEQELYIRSDSFKADPDGNLVDTSGNRLMAWGLDDEGRRPGELPSNLEPLSPVNITCNATSELLTRKLCIHDEFAQPHDFEIKYKKLPDTSWRVGVYASKDGNDEFEIDVDNDEGLVVTGVITFDGD